MKASTAATLVFCLCSNFAAAQCASASVSPATLRGTDLIKTAAAAATPVRDGAVVLAVATREVAAAATREVASPRKSSSTTTTDNPAHGDDRNLLLAGLALMAGIALRRYSAGPR